MKKLVLIVFFGLLYLTSLSQTWVSPGAVSGKWIKTNSPYLITGDIFIPEEATLEIEPGTEIVFTYLKGGKNKNKNYKFTFFVLGKLMATGTETQKIIFKSSDPLIGWGGIKYIKPISEKNSRISNCIMENRDDVVKY